MRPIVGGLEVDLEALERLGPEEQAAVQAQLVELEKAFKANPLLGYRPHGKQVVFHSPPFPPLRAFFGGNRSGKTTAAMVDTIIQAIDEDVVPEHLKPFKRWPAPFKCRVMTPDFGSTFEVVLEKIREWCPKGQLRASSFERAYDKQQRILWFKNGSKLHFNSNIQDREQLGGMAFHRIVYDEEPRQDLRNESAMRLADFDGEEIFALTPFSGMAWLWDEVYEPWEVLESQGFSPAQIEEMREQRMVVVDMDDNPHLSEAGKRRALAKYTGPERDARKSGKFVSFAGLVYPTWDEDRHVVPDEDELPEGVECFEGLDPGLRVAGVVFCYLDWDDRLVVYDELAVKGKTVKVVCEEIFEKRKLWGVVPAWTVMDPAARNKNSQTGRSDEAEYQKHGLFAFKGVNDVRPGINAVTERLDEKKLLVCERCVELRSEFRKYRWPKKSTRTEDDPKLRPVKKDDHVLDSLRYVVVQRPLTPTEPRPVERVTAKDRLLKAHFDRIKKFGSRRQASGAIGPGQFS